MQWLLWPGDAAGTTFISRCPPGFNRHDVVHRMKRLCFALFVAAFGLAGTLPARALSWSDFEGIWVIAEAESNGAPVTDDSLATAEYRLTQGKYEFEMGDTKADGTVTLDDSHSPAWMNVKEVNGPNAGRTIQEIVEKTADGWRVALTLDGGERPTSFKTGPGQLMVRFVRKPGTVAPTRPLRALLITGGCCHEYAKQSTILAQGLSQRANIEVTVVQDPGADGTQHRISVYESEKWAGGYDIILHNECYSDEKDPAWLERIVKPHREGVPAVVIHCAMHCYRAPTNDWFQFVGVTSRRHGSHFAYPTMNVKPQHPVMMGFPTVWQTPMEELYHIESVSAAATPLAVGYSHETKKGEANVWINQYGKARVFGTTIGHYAKTMSDPVFLDLVARGTLWAAGKLTEEGKPAPGFGPK